MRTLPESVIKLPWLETLSLAGNRLTELPEFIGQLHKLQELDLTGNWLTALPDSLCGLAHLRVLILADNRISNFPDILGRLTSLRVLILARNGLREIPDALVLLPQLAHLDLTSNPLTRLPKTIGYSNLQTLILDNNPLIELPGSIKSMKRLRSIFLHGCTTLDLPEEVLGPPIEDVVRYKMVTPKARQILDYYFRTKGGAQPLNEAKLIFVGRGGVGKTSLVNRLAHGRFDKAERKTEGICITGWKLMIGDEEIRLNIWDFGGQEIMHATHQFFLTQRALYVLVINGREGGEDADAEYWLKLIESFGGDSPVVVVMNKIKEHSFDLNRRALEKKYPIRDFIKTDCEDGTGIEDLRHVIQRETDRLEHLRDAFPASWFTIKNKLADFGDNYLSFAEYRHLCAEYGEMDADAQEALAGYLHNLGIVLNYKDDPRLQDTHVLNPHWVTNGIYQVLNSELLDAQKGEIRLEGLTQILDAEEYPPSMRRFIFDLMKKFDLCFSFPDDDTHYLIPELLDKQEPEDAAAFRPEECLNFQYHYPVLPEGLLPRFIVRTHSLSEGLPRWRSGVILSFEGNRALVKADVQEKRVFISVSGPQVSRRRLLAVIRADFERIHRDIRNLQPQEMVPLPGQPSIVIPYKKLFVMEQQGVKSFLEVVGEEVIELIVDQLLNGVDFTGARRNERRAMSSNQALRLFYSYSHKDESLRDRLSTHLKLLQRQGMIETWHDRNINAGDDWKQKIDDNLERADIVLLLVSADFIASDYCYEKEMKRALERHNNGEAVVIPVIVRDVNWMTAPFARLQGLPQDGLAVTLWPDQDSAWRNVSDGIEKVAMRIRKSL
jgi:internalin A